MSVFLKIIICILLIEFPKLILMEEKLSVHDKERDWETLEDFGYHYNENGELRHILTSEKFEFNLYENHKDNQFRYERLGKIVEKHIYKLLEDETKLLRTTIPTDHDANEGKGFIFRSEDSFTCGKLMLIIHGSGVVRAGQWARRLIINHSLESGTQLLYIKKAKDLGFGVLVLNSNQNYDDENGNRIRGSETPEDHFQYVWDEFVLKSEAQHVAIIAHSYGGVITTRAAAVIPTVIGKTFAVAFTDSVHFGVRSFIDQQQYSYWMQNKVCNWVSSSKDLNTPLRSHEGNCPNFSAGTQVHEETSWKAFAAVWRFIQDKWEHLQQTVNKADKEMEHPQETVNEANKEMEHSQETVNKADNEMEHSQETVHKADNEMEVEMDVQSQALHTDL